MKRPPLITFFAALVTFEAVYELILFPISHSNPQFKPLLDQLKISLDILIPFGIVKGIYALIAALGLWSGFKLTPYYLWFITPLFPIASIFLVGSVDLSPFSIPLSIAYVFYLRKPDVAQWFNQEKIAKPMNVDFIVSDSVENQSPIKSVRANSVFETIGLFLTGYVLLNIISSTAMLSWPIQLELMLMILFEATLMAVVGALSVRFGKVENWKHRIGNVLYYTGMVGLFYAVMLYGVLDSPSADALNELFQGNLNSRVVLMTGLYSLFVILIGFPMRDRKPLSLI